MSASTVIADVTDTVQGLLKTQQQPADLFDISLKSPAEETIDQVAKPKVNLFLFRVLENSFARNQDWQPVGTGELQYPPLALDLLYVLTPFAAEKLDEHRVLGEAMRILHDNAITKAPLLKGTLEHTAEELKIDLCQFQLEEATKIWTALTKPYRLSVCYEVRMVMIDSTVQQSITRVIERVEHYSQL